MSDVVGKLEQNGKVAVLVSRGFGAGWSSWNSDHCPACLFDPDIAQAVLAGDKKLAHEIATKKYPEAYCGGVGDLHVEWVDKGDRFEIDEYDGSENLRVFGPDDGYVA